MTKKKGGEKHESGHQNLEHTHSTAEHLKLQEKILENLVELQKVHTSMAEKFDKLTEQMSSLLGLFESAAKSFGEHPANQVAEKDKDFLEKVDKLLEQNKLIAKGLTIVEERMRERVYGNSRPSQEMPRQEKQPEDVFAPSAQTRPLPRF